MELLEDKIVVSPFDIDLTFSPLKKQLDIDTYVLGAFNPGMVRLPNGNILLMIRVAEAIKNPVQDNRIHFIHWSEEDGYSLQSIKMKNVDFSDPRKFKLTNTPNKVYGLTSFSWLLPVELTEDGLDIVKFHYDKIIEPRKRYQEYGIEDARITVIDNKYYMTTCSVSSERHSTTLYVSDDGLDYILLGIIQDHQNKDMLLFPEKINNYYYALTRPMGDHYFIAKKDSDILPGPSINLSRSPDLLHWKPVEGFFIAPLQNSKISQKLGGGAQPILTDDGWLILFHGVENYQTVGNYRTFWCVLKKDKPNKIKYINLENPVMESNSTLTNKFDKIKYVDNVVFTTGIEEYNNKYIIASGELDLCCRITHVLKNNFCINEKL